MIKHTVVTVTLMKRAATLASHVCISSEEYLGNFTFYSYLGSLIAVIHLATYHNIQMHTQAQRHSLRKSILVLLWL